MSATVTHQAAVTEMAGLVTSICQAVQAFGVAERTEVTGPHHYAVSEVRRRLSGLFVPRAEPWMPSRLYSQIVEHYAMFGEFDVVHARLPDLRLLDIERLHGLGLLVHASDVNGAEELTQTAWPGADRLTTNRPAEALNFFTTPLPHT